MMFLVAKQISLTINIFWKASHLKKIRKIHQRHCTNFAYSQNNLQCHEKERNHWCANNQTLNRLTKTNNSKRWKKLLKLWRKIQKQQLVTTNNLHRAWVLVTQSKDGNLSSEVRIRGLVIHKKVQRWDMKGLEPRLTSIKLWRKEGSAHDPWNRPANLYWWQSSAW